MQLVQPASDINSNIAFSMEPIANAGRPESSDQALVDVTSDGSVTYWMETFAVSEEQIRRAVAAVGADACAVKDFLGVK